MQLKDLRNKLKSIAPALSTKDFVEVMKCLCFEEGVVIAFDDVLTMSVPIESPIRGGIAGKALTDFLGVCTSKEVQIEADENEARFKSGRSKIALPCLPMGDFLHQWPEADEESVKIKTPKALVDTIAQSLPTMGTDPTQSGHFGVTLQISKGDAVCYSSDDLSASRAQHYDPLGKKGVTAALSPRFCFELVSIVKTETLKSLRISEAWSDAWFASGLRLFGKCVGDASVEIYTDNVFAESRLEKLEGLFVAIPKSLKNALRKVAVVLANSPDGRADMIAKDGKLRLKASSPVGVVSDVMKYEGVDLKEKINAELVLRCMDGMEEIAVLEGECMAMRGGGVDRLVTVYGE